MLSLFLSRNGGYKGKFTKIIRKSYITLLQELRNVRRTCFYRTYNLTVIISVTLVE